MEDVYPPISITEQISVVVVAGDLSFQNNKMQPYNVWV